MDLEFLEGMDIDALEQMEAMIRIAEGKQVVSNLGPKNQNSGSPSRCDHPSTNHLILCSCTSETTASCYNLNKWLKI